MAARSSSRGAVARSAARLGAVQALYQMDLAQTDLADVLAEIGSTRRGEMFEDGQMGHADTAFASDLVQGVVRDQALVDRAVEACLAVGWTLPRLDATVRAILRAAAYELMFRTDVPARVAIAEYVDLAAAFFDGAEPRFINGLLDSLAKQRRAEEMAAR